MKRVVVGVLLVVLFAAVAAADGWKNLVGSPAPRISATTWLNVPEGTPSTESLQGRVWLLCFFGLH